MVIYICVFQFVLDPIKLRPRGLVHSLWINHTTIIMLIMMAGGAAAE
jgi:hypothetical protein